MVRWYWLAEVVPAYHPLVFDGAAARIVKSPRRRCARGKSFYKGAKARMVPFGDMLWAQHIVEIWLDGREAGAVFTAMIDGRGDMLDQRTTLKRMTTRSVQRMLKRYPVSIDGVPTTVTPHDLRRSYARNLFLAGIPTEVIRQNLGHADVKTTHDYIGVLDGSTHAPVSVYDASAILQKLL